MFLRQTLRVAILAAFPAYGLAACGTTTPPSSSAGSTAQSSSTSSSGSAVSSSGVAGSGGNEQGSGGSGGMGGNAGSGGMGGTAGSGGQGNGGAGGSGGCTKQTALCSYKTDTDLDKDSFRRIAGYNCYNPSTGWDFVPVVTCDFSEVCEVGNGPEAACISCGPKGQRFGYREVDGMVSENCKGCGCGGGWSVYGCYAETATYGAAWANIVWQQGFEVISFALLETGEVKGIAAPNKQMSIQTLQVNAFEIQPNGLVDFDIAAQVLATDNFQQLHTWDMQARVVGICK